MSSWVQVRRQLMTQNLQIRAEKHFSTDTYTFSSYQPKLQCQYMYSFSWCMDFTFNVFWEKTGFFFSIFCIGRRAYSPKGSYRKKNTSQRQLKYDCCDSTPFTQRQTHTARISAYWQVPHCNSVCPTYIFRSVPE